MLTKDKGIVLRNVNYSETSQILTFFTELNGKVSAIAKGSRRPKNKFAGPLEILTAGEMVIMPGADDRLWTLTEFEQIFYPVSLRKSLPALNSVLLAAEILNILTIEHDIHQRLYMGMLEFMQEMERCADERQILLTLLSFQLFLLKETGGEPVLDFCVNCKSHYGPLWQRCFFSSTASGLVCRDCQGNFADKIELSKTVADCLSDRKKMLNADKTSLLAIERLLISHITSITSRRLKMADMVLRIFKR
ncbi:MAG: DNA repair protein RecO [Anaerohalosphaeraceae bacterium]|nr:DNA repair protein RecO [Anaerohalosphaeraceae bacterium]